MLTPLTVSLIAILNLPELVTVFDELDKIVAFKSLHPDVIPFMCCQSPWQTIKWTWIDSGLSRLRPKKSLWFLVTTRVAVDLRVSKIKIVVFCIKRFPKAAKLT